MREACATAYDAGARWFNGNRTVMANQVHFEGAIKADAYAKGVVHDELVRIQNHTHALHTGRCAARDGGSESLGSEPLDAFRVEPKKGSAIVFWHDLLNGTGDPFAWHAGCAVTRGTKWT